MQASQKGKSRKKIDTQRHKNRTKLEYVKKKKKALFKTKTKQKKKKHTEKRCQVHVSESQAGLSKHETTRRASLFCSAPAGRTSKSLLPQNTASANTPQD